MGKDELEGILEERGAIEVICEFCSEHYHFDQIDVDALLLAENLAADSSTVH
jgi:molecular chaperone Hsp33